MDVEERVSELVMDQLGVTRDELTPEKSLIEDLGADSLDIVELVMSIEEAFDIEITDEEAERLQTIGDAISFLKGKIGS